MISVCLSFCLSVRTCVFMFLSVCLYEHAHGKKHSCACSDRQTDTCACSDRQTDRNRWCGQKYSKRISEIYSICDIALLIDGQSYGGKTAQKSDDPD